MQVNDDYIDELFAVKLGNMEATPPEDGWVRIENELNRRVSLTKKIWTAAAASLALILSVTASIYYIQNSSSIPTPANEGEISQIIYESPTIIEEYNDTKIIDQTLNDTEIVDQIRYNTEIVENVSNEEEYIISESVTMAVTPISPINIKTIDIDPIVIEPTVADPIIDLIIVASIKDESIIVEPVTSDPIIVEPNITEPIIAVPITSDPIIVDPIVAKQPINVDVTNGRFGFTQSPGEYRDTQIATGNNNLLGISGQTRNDEWIKNQSFNDVMLASRKRWSVMGQFTPMQSYRIINSVPIGLRISDFDDAESPLLAYSGGVALSYRVFNRLSVQTGVFYSQMGQSINNVTPVTNMNSTVSSNNSYNKNFVKTSSGSVAVASNLKSDVNTTYSSYFNDEPQMENSIAVSNVNIPNFMKYKLIERVDYLEIPLMLRYFVFDKKLNFYLSGGMSANILLETSVFVDNGSELVKSGTILMARPLNYSSTVGLGVGYNFKRNISVGFEPSLKYYMNSYTTNSQIESNPYAFGVSTGLTYRF